ncbi:MAG: hypothetical protein QM808_11410 [Steroidobacteraceae bacterium]
MYIDNELKTRDIVTDYWDVYLEWRAAYGLTDACMGELLAALRVESQAFGIDTEQRTKLRTLARLIELELSAQGATKSAA